MGTTVCQHKFWYCGADYIAKKLGNAFFDTHERPQFGTTVEVCRDCGEARYFCHLPAHLANIISGHAKAGLQMKETRYAKRREYGEDDAHNYDWD